MDLYLIRHTRTQAEPGICYGASDVPLAATHAEDCAAVADRLPAVQALWSSPLLRCRTLAEAIAQRSGVAPRFDARLAELDFGEWEGRRWDAIERRQSEAWAEAVWRVAPPGGQTYRELYERTGAALAQICTDDTRCAAVVAHAGPIRAALAHCLRWDEERFPETPLDYGGIALLRGSARGWRLEYLNG
jgi:alpha-ribazole phosphatase